MAQKRGALMKACEAVLLKQNGGFGQLRDLVHDYIPNLSEQVSTANGTLPRNRKALVELTQAILKFEDREVDQSLKASGLQVAIAADSQVEKQFAEAKAALETMACNALTGIDKGATIMTDKLTTLAGGLANSLAPLQVYQCKSCCSVPEQLERNQTRRGLAANAKVSAKVLEDLVNTLATGCQEQVDGEASKANILQKMKSSGDSHQCVADASKTLHTEMSDQFQTHADCTIKRIAGVAEEHVELASRFHADLESFNEIVTHEFAQETRDQKNVFQKRINDLSDQCMTFVKANLDPVAYKPFQQALSEKAAAEEEFNAIVQEDLQITEVLGRVKVTLEKMLPAEGPPAKKGKWSIWPFD